MCYVHSRQGDSTSCRGSRRLWFLSSACGPPKGRWWIIMQTRCLSRWIYMFFFYSVKELITAKLWRGQRKQSFASLTICSLVKNRSPTLWFILEWGSHMNKIQLGFPIVSVNGWGERVKRDRACWKIVATEYYYIKKYFIPRFQTLQSEVPFNFQINVHKTTATDVLQNLNMCSLALSITGNCFLWSKRFKNSQRGEYCQSPDSS